MTTDTVEQKTAVLPDEYKVNLDVFEGPLDLLLYLIRKNDLEITDIPMALITEEYLKFLDAMKELDVNVAGEYLLMAAELMQIKSKMLLPIDEQGDAEAIEEDPREDLMRRLMEYQRYKEASQTLTQRTLLNRDDYRMQAPEAMPSRAEVLKEENVFKLLEAFQKLLKKIPDDRVREVTIDRISVNERIFELLEMVKRDQTMPIEGLLPEDFDRYDLVVTFLALLEMAKLNMIKVFQAGQFQKLYITGKMEDVSQDDALQLVDEDTTR